MLQEHSPARAHGKVPGKSRQAARPQRAFGNFDLRFAAAAYFGNYRAEAGAWAGRETWLILRWDFEFGRADRENEKTGAAAAKAAG